MAPMNAASRHGALRRSPRSAIFHAMQACPRRALEEYVSLMSIRARCLAQKIFRRVLVIGLLILLGLPGVVGGARGREGEHTA